MKPIAAQTPTSCPRRFSCFDTFGLQIKNPENQHDPQPPPVAGDATDAAAVWAEHALPSLLLLGLFTRLSGIARSGLAMMHLLDYKTPMTVPMTVVNATSALALRNCSIFSIVRSWDSSMLITISG